MSFPEGLSDDLIATIKTKVRDMIEIGYDNGVADGYGDGYTEGMNTRAELAQELEQTAFTLAATVRLLQWINHRDPVLYRDVQRFLSIEEEEQVRKACQ
jgi:hypothetical protein